jgi:hypothetical protein
MPRFLEQHQRLGRVEVEFDRNRATPPGMRPGMDTK